MTQVLLVVGRPTSWAYVDLFVGGLESLEGLSCKGAIFDTFIGYPLFDLYKYASESLDLSDYLCKVLPILLHRHPKSNTYEHTFFPLQPVKTS